MIRLAIIGCGSVTQQYHLPAAAACPSIRLASLVDANRELLNAVRARWYAPQQVTDYRDVRESDAVLIATPHALHAPMCEHFLQQGLHVLVEKPMTVRAADAERLVALAREKRLVFAVGVFRRYYPVSAFLKSAIQNGEMAGLGALIAIDAEEGGVYDWLLQSRFLLDRALAGGGVLIDTGSHLFDRLLWWLPEFTVRIDSYRDDSSAGVEADCELRASFVQGARAIACRVAMSRIRNLRNTIRLIFEKGTIECGANAPDVCSLRVEDWRQADALRAACGDPALPTAYFTRQLEDFARAIERGERPLNDAESNLPTVRLIEQCYAARAPLAHAWEDPT